MEHVGGVWDLISLVEYAVWRVRIATDGAGTLPPQPPEALYGPFGQRGGAAGLRGGGGGLGVSSCRIRLRLLFLVVILLLVHLVIIVIAHVDLFAPLCRQGGRRLARARGGGALG